ncbi:alpha/beta hydrolase [Mycobacteroides chelonae]|uniref:Alpha/beta hydrolase n=1 Tax=Mycobacteroides chelonae TaxID=1774 RepID=A0A1S1M5C4_MYCCH|nr:alpha/beta hydrolase [Mycobacteroides chelonae]OHU23979.1 alpha/beta hydrolase [Mycobacteroides chelonae]OHU78048.1 alpha/beta hydrolase [Mycobacteroides chelonae]QQG86772.1 alpha/beta fold hydrolase [Mycobacteroides chelonae]QQG91589.1 alpha/beta fold hydrolase [Mycobacteroides chelonae]
MTTSTTERVGFSSAGIRCAGWLTRPAEPGRHPAVVLVHGLGATHDMMLPQYERHFASAGIATLAFDYRHTGASEGSPRQQFSMRKQRHDVESAIAFLQNHPDIDGDRIALWGTSLGAMHVTLVAAGRDDLAAAVIQCPIVHGPGAARTSSLWSMMRLGLSIVEDLLRMAFGRPRRYVPIVGPPGSSALVSTDGALAGWESTCPPGHEFDNRMTAAEASTLVFTSALRRARKISAPLLVCVCDREELTSPRYAELVARGAPRGVELHYESGHFDIYQPPVLERALSEQTLFLREHLHVAR